MSKSALAPNGIQPVNNITAAAEELVPPVFPIERIGDLADADLATLSGDGTAGDAQQEAS